MFSDHILCEETLIQTYLAPLADGYDGALGLRDDCALIDVAEGSQLVVKTDPVRAGVHFFADDAPGDIAFKALAVNVSDLAAKAAKPLAYVMALSFAQPPERSWMQAFAQGLREAQTSFKMHLIGGDTDRADGPMTISITAFGTVPTGEMVQRGTARPGDLLFASGTLGDAALGLELRRDKATAQHWGLTNIDQQFLLGRYLRPAARVELRTALAGHANAAMDLSDGLAKDAARMCNAAKVKATIRFATIPLSRATACVIASEPSRRMAAITAGDDYEILAAVPPQKAQGFRDAAHRAGVTVQQIGEISQGKGVIILDEAGRQIELDRLGWDHF